jgi:hypothetical protein
MIFAVAGALLLAWLAKKAFQGRCAATGVSEGHAAWILLKWIVFLGIAGFLALLGLAAYLDSLPGNH